VLDISDFSTSDGGTPGAAWSPDTYTYWESDPAGGGAEFEFILDLHNTTLADVDYIAIQGHNFFVNGSAAPYSFQLFYSTDNVSFSPCFAEIEAENSGAIAVCFETRDEEYFRLIITSQPCSETTAIIAHLRIGEFLKLQRKIYVGVMPFTLSKTVEKTVTISENGKYLGAHVKSVVNNYKFEQIDNTPGFVRLEINDFLDHVDLITPDYNLGPGGTFFCAWRPLEYPDEILYCHPGKMERPSNQRSNGMMQWKISGEAEA